MYFRQSTASSDISPLSGQPQTVALGYILPEVPDPISQYLLHSLRMYDVERSRTFDEDSSGFNHDD